MLEPSPSSLQAALAAAAAQVASLEEQHAHIVAATRDANADDEHDPEGATLAFEREQLSALLAQARRRHDDVLRALDLVEQGAYGRCERCGEPIGAARLEARPTARTCIACARQSR